MSYTNQTPHYHLPQYVGSDILNPLTDLNTAFEEIDTALYDIGESAGSEASKVANLESKVGTDTLDTVAQNLSGAVNELKTENDEQATKIAGAEADIDVLEGQMSTANGNITTLATSVAGLEVGIQSKADKTALNDLVAKVGTGNLDTVAQNCVDAINEVKAAIPSGGSAASSITYDNTDSGLTATNVQDAIDEVKSEIPTSFNADSIVYDNSNSGLSATEVQSAIDEVVTMIPTGNVSISESGSKLVASVAAGTSSDGVTFAKNYTNPPIVLVGIACRSSDNATTNDQLIVVANAITNTGFSAMFHNFAGAAGTNIRYNYLVISTD